MADLKLTGDFNLDFWKDGCLDRLANCECVPDLERQHVWLRRDVLDISERATSWTPLPHEPGPTGVRRIGLLIDNLSSDWLLPMKSDKKLKTDIAIKVTVEHGDGMDLPLRFRCFYMPVDQWKDIRAWRPEELGGPETGPQFKGMHTVSHRFRSQPGPMHMHPSAGLQPLVGGLEPKDKDPELGNAVHCEAGVQTATLTFKGLEFLRPTRMTPVYLVIATCIGRDVLLTTYHRPTICICRGEQRVVAISALGVAPEIYFEIERRRGEAILAEARATELQKSYGDGSEPAVLAALKARFERANPGVRWPGASGGGVNPLRLARTGTRSGGDGGGARGTGRGRRGAARGEATGAAGASPPQPQRGHGRAPRSSRRRPASEDAMDTSDDEVIGKAASEATRRRSLCPAATAPTAAAHAAGTAAEAQVGRAVDLLKIAPLGLQAEGGSDAAATVSCDNMLTPDVDSSGMEEDFLSGNGDCNLDYWEIPFYVQAENEGRTIGAAASGIGKGPDDVSLDAAGGQAALAAHEGNSDLSSVHFGSPLQRVVHADAPPLERDRARAPRGGEQSPWRQSARPVWPLEAHVGEYVAADGAHTAASELPFWPTADASQRPVNMRQHIGRTSFRASYTSSTTGPVAPPQGLQLPHALREPVRARSMTELTANTYRVRAGEILHWLRAAYEPFAAQLSFRRSLSASDCQALLAMAGIHEDEVMHTFDPALCTTSLARVNALRAWFSAALDVLRAAPQWWDNGFIWGPGLARSRREAEAILAGRAPGSAILRLSACEPALLVVDIQGKYGVSSHGVPAERLAVEALGDVLVCQQGDGPTISLVPEPRAPGH